MTERRFYLAKTCTAATLAERVQLAMDHLPHNHPGVPGVGEGNGCLRCNAEHALAALTQRARMAVDF